MDPFYAFLLVAGAVFGPVAVFVWYMARKQRLEEEAAEGHDISAE